MQKEIRVEEVPSVLDEEIEETIIVKRENKADAVIMSIEEYKRILESNLVEKLKKAEEQIEKGEVIEGDIVFAEMREKYEY